MAPFNTPGQEVSCDDPFPGSCHILLLTGCVRPEAIRAAPPQTAATWLTIQPYTAIGIGPQEIILVHPSASSFVCLLRVLDHVIVAKKGYFSFREAGLIP